MSAASGEVTATSHNAVDSMLSMVNNLEETKSRLLECIKDNLGKRSQQEIDNLFIRQSQTKVLMNRASVLSDELSSCVLSLCSSIKNNKSRGRKLSAETLDQLKLLANGGCDSTYSVHDVLNKTAVSELDASNAVTIVFGDNGSNVEQEIMVEVTDEAVSHIVEEMREECDIINSGDHVIDERVEVKDGQLFFEGQPDPTPNEPEVKVYRPQIRPCLSVRKKVISYGADDADMLDETSVNNEDENGDAVEVKACEIEEVKGGVAKKHAYLHIPAKKKPSKITKTKYAYLNAQRQCQYCGLVMRKAQMGRHMASHFNRFKCDLCPKMFYWKSEIERHRRTHTKDKTYPCKQCDMVYTAPSSLHAHVKNHHKNERSFICCTCGLQFNERYRMENHIRIVHDQDRPFTCDICGKTCADKTNLRYHMRTHGRNISSVKGRGGTLMS